MQKTETEEAETELMKALEKDQKNTQLRFALAWDLDNDTTTERYLLIKFNRNITHFIHYNKSNYVPNTYEETYMPFVPDILTIKLVKY